MGETRVDTLKAQILKTKTIGDTQYCALDTETYGLSAKLNADTPMWCASFAWYGSNDEIKDEVLQWEPDVAELINELTKEGIVWVIHNAAFDVPALRLRGCHLPPGSWVDSMLLAYLMQPDSKENHSLDAWGERLGIAKLDYRKSLIDAGLLDPKTKKGEEFKIPFNDIMKEYAGTDARITIRLWEYLNHPRLNDALLFRAYYFIELPYQELIIQMEKTGSYMDRDYLQELKVEVEQELKELSETITSIQRFAPDTSWDADKKEYYGKTITYAKKVPLGGSVVGDTSYTRSLTPRGRSITAKRRNADPLKPYGEREFLGFDVDELKVLLESEKHYEYTWEHCPLEEFKPKASHLAWFLMTYGGWKPKKNELTDAGLPATSADVLSKIKVDGERPRKMIDAVVRHQNLSKLLGTYIEPLLEESSKDGFVHGSFIQTNTKTTRLSSEKPNLQNIDPRVKPAFNAPPGYIIAIADLDRIELVVLAWFLESILGSSTMANAIRRGDDLHQINADAWGLKRKIAKVVIFLLIYGGGANKLAQSANVSVDEAQSIIDQVYANMPELQDLKDWIVLQAKQVQPFQWDDMFTGVTVVDGFLRLLGGQRVYVPDIFNDPNGKLKWKYREAERQLGNYAIQGSAGSINKVLHLNTYLFARLSGSLPFIVVHDENGLYIPLEVATNEYLDLLTNRMSSDIMLKDGDRSLPVTAEYHYGFDWSEAKEGTFCNLKNKERWVEWQEKTKM